MPALPDVPQVLKVRVLWSVGPDTAAVNVLHFKYSGTAPDNTACTTIAADIYTAAATHLVPFAADQTKLTGVEVTDLTSPISGSGSHFASTTGTSGSELLPGGVAVLQSLKIQRRYRGGKPRTYWPLFTAASLTTALQWDTTVLGNLNTALQLWENAIFAITVSGTSITNQVNISYYQGFTVSAPDPITGRVRDVPTPRVVPLVDIIGTWKLDPHPASQRRRNLQGV